MTAHGRVVAEGVETDQQLQALARYPVDLVQGFLFDRPRLADAFAERCSVLLRELGVIKK